MWKYPDPGFYLDSYLDPKNIRYEKRKEIDLKIKRAVLMLTWMYEVSLKHISPQNIIDYILYMYTMSGC